MKQIKYSKEFIEKLDNKCADLEENLFKLEPMAAYCPKGKGGR